MPTAYTHQNTPHPPEQQQQQNHNKTSSLFSNSEIAPVLWHLIQTELHVVHSNTQLNKNVMSPPQKQPTHKKTLRSHMYFDT